MTTREDIQSWFERGVQQDYSYMVVICDTFSHEDYPIYYDNKDACLDRIENPGDMARVMEVYDLSMDMQTQLNERRAFHPPSRFTTQPKMDAKVLAEMEGDFDVSAGGFNPLENLYSGKTVVMPVDAFHAKAMVSIGMKYLEDNGYQRTPPMDEDAQKTADRLTKDAMEKEEPELCPTCRQPDQPLAIYYICDGCERAWKEVENGHTDNPYAEPNVVETPEQAHGDALASLNRIRQAIECPVQYAEETARDFAIVRRHLTASGVPDRREIFYRLANYESDEPYEGGDDQPQFSLSRYVLDQWLAQDHCGDCTNVPMTCSRCFAERCWHKAGWIAAAPTYGEDNES